MIRLGGLIFLSEFELYTATLTAVPQRKCRNLIVSTALRNEWNGRFIEDHTLRLAGVVSEET